MARDKPTSADLGFKVRGFFLNARKAADPNTGSASLAYAEQTSRSQPVLALASATASEMMSSSTPRRRRLSTTSPTWSFSNLARSRRRP